MSFGESPTNFQGTKVQIEPEHDFERERLKAQGGVGFAFFKQAVPWTDFSRYYYTGDPNDRYNRAPILRLKGIDIIGIGVQNHPQLYPSIEQELKVNLRDHPDHMTFKGDLEINPFGEIELIGGTGAYGKRALQATERWLTQILGFFPEEALAQQIVFKFEEGQKILGQNLYLLSHIIDEDVASDKELSAEQQERLTKLIKRSEFQPLNKPWIVFNQSTATKSRYKILIPAINPDYPTPNESTIDASIQYLVDSQGRFQHIC